MEDNNLTSKLKMTLYTDPAIEKNARLQTCRLGADNKQVKQNGLTIKSRKRSRTRDSGWSPELQFQLIFKN